MIYRYESHLLLKIEHFFQVYKDLENKTVDVGGWGDVDEAYKIIKICSDRFDQIENKPEDYLVFLYNILMLNKKKQYSVKSVAFLFTFVFIHF
jgi:hypothetical protein